MRNLLEFLQKYSNLLLFLMLEAVAFVLLVNHNHFQQTAFLSSANYVVGRIYEAENSVIEYFHLGRVNQDLAQENAELLRRINDLENLLESHQEVDTAVLYKDPYVHAERNLDFLPAKVINLSTNLERNRLTINKGTDDGVALEMGVIDHDGVVGTVSAVSRHFATVIPIVNTEMSISCRFKGTDYVGPVQWDGIDYRYAKMEDVARHAEVHEGDTLLTSGLTTAFPEGVMVGVVDKVKLEETDSYYHIRVRLSANFRKLRYVQVVQNKERLEQMELEGWGE